MADVNAQYVIAEASEASLLEKKVTRLIQENWLPQGGVMIIHYGEGNYLYAQAMVFCVDRD